MPSSRATARSDSATGAPAQRAMNSTMRRPRSVAGRAGLAGFSTKATWRHWLALSEWLLS